jgi:hypothetical protein
MKKKLVFVLLGILVTLFFLAVCIYNLQLAFSDQLVDGPLISTQIAGWVSFVLFVLSVLHLLLLLKSNNTHSTAKS